jgi:hypothetical protein
MSPAVGPASCLFPARRLEGGIRRQQVGLAGELVDDEIEQFANAGAGFAYERIEDINCVVGNAQQCRCRIVVGDMVDAIL